MEVRDAVEADAGRLAALTDAPTDVMRNLVHDRTVRVAVSEHSDDADTDAGGDAGAGGDGDGGSASESESSARANAEPNTEPNADSNGDGEVGTNGNANGGGAANGNGTTDGNGADTDGDEAAGDEAADGNSADTDETIAGFVSFDAQRDTVHVTQLEGGVEACARLLEEPVRFARGEGMGVELLAAVSDEDTRGVAEDAGFTNEGRGPRFEGTPTVRYRLEP